MTPYGVVDGIADEHRRDLLQERLLIVTPNMLNPGGDALAYFDDTIHYCLAFRREGVVFVRPVIAKEGETLKDTEGRELDPGFGFFLAASGLASTYGVPLDCQDRTCFMYLPQEGERWDGAQYQFCTAHADALRNSAVAYSQYQHNLGKILVPPR